MRFSWELVLVMICLYSAFGITDTTDSFGQPTWVSWNATLVMSTPKRNRITVNSSDEYMCQSFTLDVLCNSQESGSEGTYPNFLPCSVNVFFDNERSLDESGSKHYVVCSMNVTFNVVVLTATEGDKSECFCRYHYSDPYCQRPLQGLCLGGFSNRGDLDCNCSVRFENSFCVDPCSSEPCQNGGTCSPWLDGETTCYCHHEFTGATCDRTMMTGPKETTSVINDEMSALAMSNATTTLNSDTTAMSNNVTTKSRVVANKTTPSFTSTRQYTDPDNRCDSFPCMNNGTCLSDTNGTYNCQCHPTFTGTHCLYQVEDDQNNIVMVIGVVLGFLIVLCIPLAFVLHRYYQAKRKLRASRRAYRTEHEIVERMSSAHFTNPAYLSDKEIHGKLQAGGNIPPPISPRPIISLPSGNGPGNDIYAEYIYIDRPGVDFPSSRKGPAGKEASDNGEYIYVVDPVGNSGLVSDVEPPRANMVCPLPSAPPPSAGEYIYFDQSMPVSNQSGHGEYIYVEEPTVMETPGKQQTTYPSLFGSPKKPAPPMASVRPLPLEPPSIPTSNHDDSKRENENLYEELPEDNHAKSMDVVACDVDLDNDMYLRPDNIVK